jgi:hypothetical protein
LPYSAYTLEYSSRIGTKNGEYAERYFSLSTMPGDFEGTVFQKNQMEGLNTGLLAYEA